ncbi:hypothetical protein J8273_8645 [Carpediemonas membranifera]|uniref:Uncharacterized protein n=1 Tax=Carpediemonas membranifera TaxID=201153 RepID=A0A8J6AWE1_9EUKA|nr:hypothetical protein J8273_8645 [Carpediemonas membranifera]|eukprot:KAG9389958.1 hypothetical protein J8273_8645 [Carpediemonas membranifera]
MDNEAVGSNFGPLGFKGVRGLPNKFKPGFADACQKKTAKAVKSSPTARGSAYQNAAEVHRAQMNLDTLRGMPIAGARRPSPSHPRSTFSEFEYTSSPFSAAHDKAVSDDKLSRSRFKGDTDLAVSRTHPLPHDGVFDKVTYMPDVYAPDALHDISISELKAHHEATVAGLGVYTGKTPHSKHYRDDTVTARAGVAMLRDVLRHISREMKIRLRGRFINVALIQEDGKALWASQSDSTHEPREAVILVHAPGGADSEIIRKVINQFIDDPMLDLSLTRNAARWGVSASTVTELPTPLKIERARSPSPRRLDSSIQVLPTRAALPSTLTDPSSVLCFGVYFPWSRVEHDSAFESMHPDLAHTHHAKMPRGRRASHLHVPLKTTKTFASPYVSAPTSPQRSRRSSVGSLSPRSPRRKEEVEKMVTVDEE